MKKRKKGRRFKTWAISQLPPPQVIELEPEDLAPYRDPAEARSILEAISSASRKGGTHTKIAAFDMQVQSQADREPKQLPYKKMLSLL